MLGVNPLVDIPITDELFTTILFPLETFFDLLSIMSFSRVTLTTFAPFEILLKVIQKKSVLKLEIF